MNEPLAGRKVYVLKSRIILNKHHRAQCFAGGPRCLSSWHIRQFSLVLVFMAYKATFHRVRKYILIILCVLWNQTSCFSLCVCMCRQVVWRRQGGIRRVCAEQAISSATRGEGLSHCLYTSVSRSVYSIQIRQEPPSQIPSVVEWVSHLD